MNIRASKNICLGDSHAEAEVVTEEAAREVRSELELLEASETVGVELDELDEVASIDEAVIPVRPDIRV